MRHGPRRLVLIRFALGGLILLLVAAAAAAWLIPPLLDWNRYRAEIATFVSEDLGREVTIEGPISLSLLPEPILTAGRVSVLSAGSSDGMSISVAQLRLRLALIPLLSGRVDAQELVLHGLDVHLPWPLGPAALSLHAPLWLSSISARVEEGRLTIGSVAATAIDANLGITPDTGSYAVAGTATIAGQAWHLSARLTRAGNDGTAGLDLSLDGQGPVQGLGAMFSGQFAADGSLSGRISGRGPDLSRLIAAPAVPFRADGRLGIAAGLAVADQLAVEIAGSPARGTVSVRLAPALRLDVSLAASRLDLDAWLPALLRGAGGRLVAPIPTGIDLSAEAAVLAGGTLRGLRGSFELEPDRVILHDVATVLPGDAMLALSGQVRRTAPPAGLHFDGSASIAAPNLRTTLGWLNATGLGPLDNLPPGVLRTADLRAEIAVDSGTPAQIMLTQLNGLVDQSHIQGGLVLHPGARLSVAGALTMDRLSLDPWVTGGWAGLIGIPARLGKLDLDLQLHADQASLRGETLAPAGLDAMLEAGRLTLRRLDVQSAGARLVASGSITDAGRIADGKLDLAARADAAGPLLAVWAPILGAGSQDGLAAHLPRGPLSLDMIAAGPPEALVTRATLDLGDLHVEAQPTLDLPGAKWTSALTLRHPGAPRLLDSIGLGGTVSWLGDGSLSWVGGLSGTGPIWAPTRIASEGFDITAGSLRANGAGVFDRTAKPRLTGRITAETLPLPLPYPRAPDPLPIGLLAGWSASVKIDAGQVMAGLSPILQQTSGTLSLESGLLRFDAIAARLEEGALSGAISFDSAATPPALKAELALSSARPPAQLFELPIDLSGGTLDATATIGASGYSPNALLATLSGTLHLSVRDGTLLGVSLGLAGPHLQTDDLRSALAGGSTPFQRFDLSAALRNGAAIIGGSQITTAFGAASLTGLIDIAGQTTELRLAFRPDLPDPPEIAVRLSGAFTAPTRSPELADAARWRAAHP